MGRGGPLGAAHGPLGPLGGSLGYVLHFPPPTLWVKNPLEIVNFETIF